MSIIVSDCQHCDEQQFQTLSCGHYTIFSVAKLDVFIRVLGDILAPEKTTRTSRVYLVYYYYCVIALCGGQGEKKLAYNDVE